MLRHLHLEHFRGFATLETELTPISVLLGPNSSGKSTVLQAVRLACSALEWTLRSAPVPKIHDDWIIVWEDWPISEQESFLPPVGPEDLFEDKGSEPITIALQFDDADFIRELRLRLRYGRAEALRLDVRVRCPDLGALAKSSKSKGLSARLAEGLRGREPVAVSIPSFYGAIRYEPFVNDGRLERLLGTGEQGSVVRNLVGRLGGLKELSDFLRASVGAEIVRSTSGQALQEVERLTVEYRDKNGGLELSSAGTGLVALAALFSALSWYKPRAADRPLVFLLDEPEAHLHPKLQGDTGEHIAQLARSFGAQALIATHSVEMINRLGRRSDAALMSIDRSAPSPAVRLTSEDAVIDRLSSFCDLSPFTSLQLLRSRRIVFHEGKSDRAIIQACARARFANDPVSLAEFQRWTFAELASETNADAKDVLVRALAPLAAQAAGTDALRVIRVLDRDHHRAPVFGPERNKNGIAELDVVWSRHSIESLFLEAPCLAAWLRLGLQSRVEASVLGDLERWVAEGIESANSSEVLNQKAVDQLLVRALRSMTIGNFASAEAFIRVRDDVVARVRAEPWVHQHGKSRAHHVLEYVRNKLPVSSRSRVRHDVEDVLRVAEAPSTLSAPTLVPPEIGDLLVHLTRR